MKPTRFTLEVDSKIENLPAITAFISDALEELGTDPATAYKVQLAVDETCTNIINYAYSGGVGPIKLAMELQGKYLVITIEDKGKQFDLRSVPAPDVSADIESRKIGGLGIYFIKKLMDEVNYTYDAGRGNVLTLKKRLTDTWTNRSV